MLKFQSSLFLRISPSLSISGSLLTVVLPHSQIVFIFAHQIHLFKLSAVRVKKKWSHKHKQRIAADKVCVCVGERISFSHCIHSNAHTLFHAPSWREQLKGSPINLVYWTNLSILITCQTSRLMLTFAACNNNNKMLLCIICQPRYKYILPIIRAMSHVSEAENPSHKNVVVFFSLSN